MSMTNVIRLPGARELPKKQRALASRMDTLLLTKAGVKGWKLPPFQRPLRVNEKVRQVAEEIKGNGGVIPGVITLAELGKETYLLDGQHRREAFLLSEVEEGIVDVRICTFDDLGEMGEEFVRLNSAIVRMRPDDIIRGLENTLQPIAELRQRCPFVGYDQIRRGTRAPMLSMSALLRCWFATSTDVPMSGTRSAMSCARECTEEDSMQIIQFLNVVHGAWGTDAEYWRLWSSLNLSMAMWLWRNCVLTKHSVKTVQLNAGEFAQCAMGLSADGQYLDWLVGRTYGDRDRAPCYSRIKAIFKSRIKEKTGRDVQFPNPAWATHSGGGRTKGL